MSDRGESAVPKWVLDRISDEGRLDMGSEDLSNCRLVTVIPLGVRPAHKARILVAGWKLTDR